MANPGRAIKRILSDIKGIQEKETKSLRIYYSPDENSALKGTALIFGPEDSPYYNLPLLFEFKIPDDYPFTNPTLKFVTSDGKTRFHPNLYVEGKVCLSILGTWSGPSWTSIMTLRSILINIVALLDNEPLLHEPGYNNQKGCAASKAYTEYVEHSSLRQIVVTLERYVKEGLKDTPLKLFEDVLVEQLPTICEKTMKRLEILAESPQKTWNKQDLYNMIGKSIYP